MRMRLMPLALCLTLVWTLAAAADPSEAPLRVGLKIDSPPYAFLDKDGDKPVVRGLSPDLARLVGRALGRQVEFRKSGDLAVRRELLRQNRIDMILFDSPIPNSSDDFTFIPTSISLRRRLFAHHSVRGVVCLRDLDDKHVVTLIGDAPWQYREPPPQNVTVVESPLEALTMLEDGKADVYVAPSEEVAESFIQRNGFHNIRKVGMVLEQIPLCITVRKEDAALAEDVTRAMKRIADSGALQQLKDKWFGIDFTPPTWERYREEIVWTLGSVGALLLGIVVWNWLLKRKVRQMTRGLQSSERNFRSVIDSSPDMILVLDQEGLVRRCNPIAAKTLGIPEEEAGLLLAMALPVVDRPRLQAFLTEVFERGHAADQFHLHATGGQLRDLDIAATRMADHETGEPRVCCFARDTTERNRMEQELVQADRLATIGKMAASVAHEINNPLGIIQANVELLLARNALSEEARGSLEAIRRHTVRAGHITRDLLATARPRAPQMADLDLADMARATLSMSAPHFKGIEIAHHAPEKPAMVWGDIGLLQQVLINLLFNAKAAVGDRPDPRIDIRYCRPSGGGMRLLVMDNGKGIAREHLSDIFEPFFTAGKPEGFGLGLFISRRIIEHHGGVIYVESEPGRGTKMILELPAAPDQDAEAQHAA